MYALFLICLYYRQLPIYLTAEDETRGWFLKILTKGALGAMSESGCDPFSATPILLKMETW